MRRLEIRVADRDDLLLNPADRFAEKASRLDAFGEIRSVRPPETPADLREENPSMWRTFGGHLRLRIGPEVEPVFVHVEARGPQPAYTLPVVPFALLELDDPRLRRAWDRLKERHGR